jgi:hypothetical protein
MVIYYELMTPCRWLVQGWPPAGHRVVGAGWGLGYAIQNQSHF